MTRNVFSINAILVLHITCRKVNFNIQMMLICPKCADITENKKSKE